MSALLRRRAPKLYPPHLRYSQTTSSRVLAFGQRQPYSTHNDSEPMPESTFMHEQIRNSAGFTFSVLGRILKFTAFGIIAVSFTGLSAYEGIHMYVEQVSLSSPKPDLDGNEWGWDLEGERWSGGDLGGTDSALGVRGRHLVRAAWMVLNWGAGAENKIVVGRGGKPGAVDPRLEIAHGFLSDAIAVAEKNMDALKPGTLRELFARSADVLERMGTEDALYEARIQYERVWRALDLTKESSVAAKTASKLGNINDRLGDKADALAWWTRAIQLTSTTKSSNANTAIDISQLEKMPSNPADQRTLASTLVSLSAYYSTSKDLRLAESTQTASLALLRSIVHPHSSTQATTPQALHALYLLHRSALLSIHHAEVLFALRNPSHASVQWLSSAADSSERVIATLTGVPVTSEPPTVSSSGTISLGKDYDGYKMLSRHATTLLRDARRSAAESWNLMGVLTEDRDKHKAEECYHRALAWAEQGEGMPESERAAIERNWRRTRDAASASK